MQQERKTRKKEEEDEVGEVDRRRSSVDGAVGRAPVAAFDCRSLRDHVVQCTCAAASSSDPADHAVNEAHCPWTAALFLFLTAQLFFLLLPQ